MAITLDQLSQLLEALPSPARICDGSGEPVAQNEASHCLDWTNPDGDAPGDSDAPNPGSKRRRPTILGSNQNVRHHDLGEGLRLELLETFPRGQDSSAPAKAGRRRKTDLESLLSGLAHELRNPLSAVLTAANLVQSLPGMDEETVMLLGVVRKESLRMNRILTEFSSYIKMSPPEPRRFNLVELIRSVAAELQGEGILAPGVRIEDRLPAERFVQGDEAQLRNALLRVVQNAAEAIGDGGTLSLFCCDEDTTTTVCIADSGPGFAEDALHRAFEPFFSEKPQAIGLGLSVALLAIEANNGSIWIDERNRNATTTNSKASSEAPVPESTTVLGDTCSGSRAGAAGGACICIRLPNADGTA